MGSLCAERSRLFRQREGPRHKFRDKRRSGRLIPRGLW